MFTAKLKENLPIGKLLGFRQKNPEKTSRTVIFGKTLPLTQ
jgi:hypothetical protein